MFKRKIDTYSRGHKNLDSWSYLKKQKQITTDEKI